MEIKLSGTTSQTPSCGCCASEAAVAAPSCNTAQATETDRREETKGTKGKGPDRRECQVDRRTGLQRRQLSADAAGYDGPERRSGDERRATTLERRRGPGRRRSDDRKAAEEGEMTGYQFEFVMAIETYKRINKRLYPTWTEIMEILQKLGYRKVLPRTIRLASAPEPELYDGEE